MCASLSSGLGETTFLSYTSKFDSRVISYWSSGTGASGLLGSMSYALLTSWGLSPKNTLLVMLFIPVLMALTYWCFICEPTHPSITDESVRPLISDSNDMPSLVDSGGGDETHVLPQNTSHSHELTAYERTVFVIVCNRLQNILLLIVFLFQKLLKYMIPLMMVYLFEYFINQGLVCVLNCFCKLCIDLCVYYNELIVRLV